jgi:hypothetical protein
VRREGSTLRLDSGLLVRPDPRTVRGETVTGAWAHVCLGTPVAYDDVAVQQTRRDALAWWIPLLGDALVCVTTLALDSVHCVGAITVTSAPARWDDDPFARLFADDVSVMQTNLFCRVPLPSGPVVERYAGIAWPGGRF